MSIENRPGTRSPPISKPSTCAGSSFGPARSWRPASLPCFFGVPPDAIDQRTQVVKIAQDADMTYALATVPRAECAVVLLRGVSAANSCLPDILDLVAKAGL
jgi:hypothetical protein